MTIDSLPRALTLVLAACILFYLPGRALIRHGSTSLPPLFARLLASTIATTLLGTALAAFERFTIDALLLGSIVVAAAGLLAGRRSAAQASSSAGSAPSAGELAKDRLGPAIAVVALCFYWPAYPAFLGASDSTAYVTTGVSLAHHGTLARVDEVGSKVPVAIRSQIFDSMSQEFGSTGPPYRRMPGAMLIESLDAVRAWPCFFPVPSVWAAIFVVAGATAEEAVEQAAPGYAPVFAALALWAFWILARSWLGRAWGMFAVLLLAASGPFYMGARMPLSEPIAAFFGLAGLAIVSSMGPRLRPLDAALAGAALGAAVFTRLETGLVLVVAFALLPSLLPRPVPDGREPDSPATGVSLHLPGPFHLWFLALAALALAEGILVPGTFALPFLDHLHNAWIGYVLHVGMPSIAGLVAAAVSGLAVVAACIARFGLGPTLRWGLVLGVLAGHATASNYLAWRTPMWLSFYMGWAGLGLSAVGAALAWRRRELPPGAALALAVAISVALILFYNPHVYPSVPWGARRFVPFLLPLLLLLACYGAVRISGRSRLLGLACAAALAFHVGSGGRPAWGKNLAEGAWQQLAQLDAIIPEGGIILYDRQVSPMMVGPALWLVHDRNGIPVPPMGSVAGRRFLPGLVWNLAGEGPVHFVTRGGASPAPTPFVKMTLVGEMTAATRFLEQKYDQRPEKTERYVMPLAVYRLERSLDKRGGPLVR